MARSRQIHSVAHFEVEGVSGKIPWYTRPPIEVWRELRQFVYARDGGKCQYCQKEVELFEAHIHHRLPLSESGTNHPSNLTTLCVPCHKNRHPHMKKVVERWGGK